MGCRGRRDAGRSVHFGEAVQVNFVKLEANCEFRGVELRVMVESRLARAASRYDGCSRCCLPFAHGSSETRRLEGRIGLLLR